LIVFSAYQTNILLSSLLNIYLKLTLDDPPIIVLGAPQITHLIGTAKLQLKLRYIDIAIIGESGKTFLGLLQKIKIREPLDVDGYIVQK
jgi:radical SAM superfamily enzyme YgiQ (UPF0313 family)